MKRARPFFFFLLSAAIATLGAGCATLPDVTETIDEMPAARDPLQIASVKGLLSPKQSTALMKRLQGSVDTTDMLQRYSAVIESVSESPLTKGNKVTLLVDGAATYAAMFRAVENATDHINIETYTFEDIEDNQGRSFTDLLLQKQAEGVRVHIIYDSRGSFTTPAAFFQRLRDGGIDVTEYNPTSPLRSRGKWRLAKSDHRKLLIVDGTIAITGGVNLSREYATAPPKAGDEQKEQMPLRDTDVQIEGPAVAELQKLFLDTWQSQKGAALSERNYFPAVKEQGTALVRVLGSTEGAANRITFIMYVTAIIFAENSLHLTNAYFAPDPQIIQALSDAAGRGVDVKIILPGTTDRSLALYAGQYQYAGLLKAGVKLYRRRNAMLHAKTLVIDSVWSTVGSTNMEWWSFSNNDELNTVILSPEFAAEMEKMFADDLSQSEEIRLDEWKNRPVLIKIREWFSQLFALRSNTHAGHGLV